MGVLDHKYLNPECDASGCQWLRLDQKLQRIEAIVTLALQHGDRISPRATMKKIEAILRERNER